MSRILSTSSNTSTHRIRNLVSAARTLALATRRNARTVLAARRPAITARAREWNDTLERQGYCIIPNYATPERCAQYREEIDRAFVRLPEYVRVRSDERMFGIENASPLIAEFAHDPELMSAAESHWREPGRTMATLGARLTVRPGGLGSGEGWHRDSYFRQFKAILYLSDVEPDNGPFEFIQGSHTPFSLIRDGLVAEMGYGQTRYSDQQIEALIAASPNRLLTVVGGVGTLILANTSAVHRGRPIVSGERYSLTNYFMPTRMITERRLEQFQPLVPAGARFR